MGQGCTFAVVLFALTSSACRLDPASKPECRVTADCRPGKLCANGVCQDPSGRTPDAGPPDTGPTLVPSSCVAPAPFPSTPVLDDFNRTGPVGASWTGGATDFSIFAGKELQDNTSTTAALLWSTPFGDQRPVEAYVTLTNFDRYPYNLELLLRALPGANPSCDVISVLYWDHGFNPESSYPQVLLTYCDTVTTGTPAGPVGMGPQQLEMAGFGLGARSYPDGLTEVFVRDSGQSNFVCKFSVQLPVYARQASPGNIGVSANSSDAARWDDFGGGDAP